MTTSVVSESQRKAAKVAGLACLLAIAVVTFAFYGINARLTVAGNIAETARNIAAHEHLFRIIIACDLIYAAGLIVLLAALYVILEPISRGVALLAALCRLVFASVWVFSTLNVFGILRLLSGAEYLRGFQADQLHAMVRLQFAAAFDAYYVGLLFWGLASTLCSCLWFKSRYIPRALAVWGVISSIWAVACVLAFYIFPNFGNAVNLYSFDVPIASFEIALSFWLLFRGLRPSGIAEPDRASRRAQAGAV